MNIVIAPPIKETYEKDIRTLFPDAALFWLEELDEEKRKKALEKADVVLSRNIVGDIRKDEIPLLAKPAMVQTTPPEPAWTTWISKNCRRISAFTATLAAGPGVLQSPPAA